MAMFNAKRPEKPEPVAAGLSVIAVGMAVKGDIESAGTVKVEGTVDGHVQSKGQVLVAKGGVIDGDIDAREAVIGGAVHGSIRAVERVEVQSGAVVNGDITTRRISVAEGGSLNGQIKMGDAAAASQRPVQLPKVETRPGQPGVQTPVPSMTRPSVPVARVAVPPRVPAPGTGH